MQLHKVKGKLKEHGITYAELSTILGMSITSFSDKMNGKKRFYIDEVKKISRVLNLTDEEKIDIFLN